MLTGYPLDPLSYYLDEEQSVVDWPDAEVPAHLSIPDTVLTEPHYTLEQWTAAGFTSNYSDELFVPRLSASNVFSLTMATDLLYPLAPLNRRGLALLFDIAQNGFDSRLSHISPTVYKNVSLEARLHKPCLVVLDSWLSKKFIRGPFSSPPLTPAKINGLLLIPKGPSNVRLVTDFSRPKLSSFNDAVAPDFKDRYPLRMSTFADVRRAIQLAGSSCLMVKNDLQDAYKFLSVCAAQLPAQQFSYAGLFFYDLCMVFGDVCAVHIFSFLHNAIVLGLVLPFTSLPPELALVVIDDQVTFCPAHMAPQLSVFADKFQEVMSAIGFKLQAWSEDRMKSFGPATSGLIFGVWVDTVAGTWTFPPRKLHIMLQLFETALVAPALTLNTLQKLQGKVNYLVTIDPAFKTVSSFLSHQLQAYLVTHPTWAQTSASAQTADIHLTLAARQDLKLLRALLKCLLDRQFPLQHIVWQARSYQIFTDASGVPEEAVAGVLLSQPLRAFSIPLPTALLCGTSGHVANVKLQFRTTVLELLPIWSGILLFAPVVAHSSLHFFVDNMATCLALTKETSQDLAATLLVKLVKFTAACIDCVITVEHVKRRSTPAACLADDLTHYKTDQLFSWDTRAMYALETALPPVQQWMTDIAPDNPYQLFSAVLQFLSDIPALQHLHLQPL